MCAKSKDICLGRVVTGIRVLYGYIVGKCTLFVEILSLNVCGVHILLNFMNRWDKKKFERRNTKHPFVSIFYYK